jgi:hypothetical protein
LAFIHGASTRKPAPITILQRGNGSDPASHGEIA